MKLVVDTNVLFSFFKKDSETRKLMLNFEVLELSTPSFGIEELRKHKKLVCRKSGLSESEFEETLNDLPMFVKVFELSEYKKSVPEAKEVSPDPDDTDFFALALKLNCPIWSEDGDLKDQPRVKVISTAELIDLLKS